jgi:hypothetical protein
MAGGRRNPFHPEVDQKQKLKKENFKRKLNNKKKEEK